MHLGHLVPLLMTQWLQAALGVLLVVQMTDDLVVKFPRTRR